MYLNVLSALQRPPAPCLACNGYRMKPEALAVKIDGLHIGQGREKSIKGAAEWFPGPPAKPVSFTHLAPSTGGIQ